MPTKKNISLKQTDIDDIKQLRSWLETDKNERMSLAQVIRCAIMFAKHRKVDFIDALHN